MKKKVLLLLKNLHKAIVAYLKKKWWYVILLLGSSLYIVFNWTDITQFNEFDKSNLLFLLWIVLLIFPLFSEMELFGIKLKKAVENVKKEVKEDINDIKLRLDIISVSNSNSININNQPLPSKMELNTLQIESKRDFSRIEHQKDISIDESISPETMYLFEVRYRIEKALSNVFDSLGYPREKSLYSMIQNLIIRQKITPSTAEIILQIVNIANRGVHGEIVSKEYLDFVKDQYPNLINYLQHLKTNT